MTSAMLRPPGRRVGCLARCLNVAMGLSATRYVSPAAIVLIFQNLAGWLLFA